MQTSSIPAVDRELQSPNSENSQVVKNYLANEMLGKIFGENTYRYDLKSGTVHNVSDSRVIYLSEDFIRGVYQSLEYEAGSAWKLILKKSGEIWGRRIAKSLSYECHVQTQKHLKELSVGEYTEFLEAYFCTHGWGVMTIDLDKAESSGVVAVSLTNSLFSQALSDVQPRVDFMVTGMLRGLFEHISGVELDCVQTSVEGLAEVPVTSHFLISSPERIQTVESALENATVTIKEALVLLCQN